MISVAICLVVCGCAAEAEKDDTGKTSSTNSLAGKSDANADIPGIETIRDELDSVRLQLEEAKTELAAANASITELEKVAEDKDAQIAELKTLIASETAKLRSIYDSLQALSGGKTSESDESEEAKEASDQSAEKVTVKKPVIDSSSKIEKPVLGPEPPNSLNP